MFIAIQWTFRDSGSLLSLHSCHLGGERWGIFPTLYILHDALLDFCWSLSFCFFPSNKLYFKHGRRSKHIVHILHPPPNDIEGSAKLRSLNNSRGWHKTIFSTESCSHPTKNERITTRKSATVLKYMHTSFHTDNKATEKKRALTSFSLLWSNWSSTHNSRIYG